MSIIDEIKAAGTWDNICAQNLDQRVRDLHAMGRISEAQRRYADNLISAAHRAAPGYAEAQERAARFAEARKVANREARKVRAARKATATHPTFEVGQVVTGAGKTGTVVEVKGEGRNAILVVDVDGATANLVARFVKVVA